MMRAGVESGIHISNIQKQNKNEKNRDKDKRRWRSHPVGAFNTPFLLRARTKRENVRNGYAVTQESQ
jgi:hypothetical protein